MRGLSNSDLPLLPPVLTRYIPSVDLDATVAALAPRLVVYATGCTGCRSTGQDIAQEALAALVLRWRRFGPPESPEAFVFAVARRRAGRAMKHRALIETARFHPRGASERYGRRLIRTAGRAADGDSNDETAAQGRPRGSPAPRGRGIVAGPDRHRHAFVCSCREDAVTPSTLPAHGPSRGGTTCAMTT